MCFINSCPQIFTSTSDDIPSITTYKYINFNENPDYENGSNLNNIPIKTLGSGHVNLLLNSGATEKGDLEEKKYVINTLLEGNFSQLYDNDQMEYNTSRWWDIINDITEFLPDLSDCNGWKYRCFVNQTKFTENWRVCDCDSSCNSYGQCCIDKAATMPENEEISIKNRMYCESLSQDEMNGIYMIGDCLQEMQGTFEEDLCLRKVVKKKSENFGNNLIKIPKFLLKFNYKTTNKKNVKTKL
ncbi:hypothetical protein Anas_06391 [Armadillidium nasatum]|uniref:SMB domain-containing protein n=1 Tax=Armadillidium nasatum TaxID=96803 RepID=A0A5N5T145_9CRUS|nr:hypothetical protein Anas_06391 [Armadillidium nasatum]